ncbi:hypothetical protein DAPPUDRAFT_99338 [Daphnia pulex]|uniref:Uncharacterized protein n=1 Tax=Daphnia pulex TaxID=6669 RepID=E9G6F1_DAPPU|nr:hypothetical protein DAPPUDRAFT_99338 [Daphnia pulex]|eukprot:EFX85003.1 hypothetical protein DAPPUDRAFT_99338 [Daphnia pulex]
MESTVLENPIPFTIFPVFRVIAVVCLSCNNTLQVIAVLDNGVIGACGVEKPIPVTSVSKSGKVSVSSESKDLELHESSGRINLPMASGWVVGTFMEDSKLLGNQFHRV